MSWTDPSGHVYSTGEVVSAATMNTYIKDNLLDLDRRATLSSATVATSQTTTSTTYADLTTSGPAVTVTTGTKGFVTLTSTMSNNTTGAFAYMGFAVSGATTTAAADTSALIDQFYTGTAISRSSAGCTSTLTAGSNTFTSKYKVSSNTGTFYDRVILVIPVSS